MTDKDDDPHLAIGVTPDRRRAGIWLVEGGRKISDTAVFDAENLDEHIRALSTARAEMIPAVPTVFALSKVDVLSGCDWVSVPDGPAEHRCCAVRHPGLGWLAFRLSRKDASELAAALLGGDEGVRH